MSYRVNREKDRYSVIEKNTDLHVFKTKSSRKAKTICRSLNLGRGFNGFTPSFFTLDYTTRDVKQNPTG